jgi:hypothetical protein
MHFVNYLYELGPTVAAGAGEGPITHLEIAAWQGNTGIALEGWESRLLRNLSLAYLSESHKATKPDCPAPWADAPDLKPPVNQVAQQMRAAMLELERL